MMFRKNISPLKKYPNNTGSYTIVSLLLVLVVSTSIESRELNSAYLKKDGVNDDSVERSSFSVKGTVIDDTPQKSLAIISDEFGVEMKYYVEASLPDGYILKKIYPKYVVVQKAGGRKSLRISSSSTGDFVEYREQLEIAEKKLMFETIVSINDLVGQRNANAEVDFDVSHGLKLRSKDKILSINGFPLEPLNVPAILRVASESKVIGFEISRNGLSEMAYIETQ